MHPVLCTKLGLAHRQQSAWTEGYRTDDEMASLPFSNFVLPNPNCKFVKLHLEILILQHIDKLIVP